MTIDSPTIERRRPRPRGTRFEVMLPLSRSAHRPVGRSTSTEVRAAAADDARHGVDFRMLLPRTAGRAGPPRRRPPPGTRPHAAHRRLRARLPRRRGRDRVLARRAELRSVTRPTSASRRDYLSRSEPLPLDPAGVVLELRACRPSTGALLDQPRPTCVARASASCSTTSLPTLTSSRCSPAPTSSSSTSSRSVSTDARSSSACAASIRTLAEGIDSEDVFEVFRDAGVDLFQGLFYERPNFVSGAALPVGHGAALGALHQLQSRGADFDALEEIIRRDVALSYRLLRHVNSAFFGLPRTVGSIREALMLLGTRAVRQWAVALVLSGLEHRPHALLSTALVRARTCELVLESYDKQTAEPGLHRRALLAADAILGAPMNDILAELPLSADIEAAITRHEGVAGQGAAKTIAFERGDFDASRARRPRPQRADDRLQRRGAWADALL